MTVAKTTRKTGKVFILDTSVILHDPGCIYNFEKHDIVIPIHVVDKLRYLKKDPNYNQVIEFCRTLDSLTEDNVFNNDSVQIGESLGMLEIRHSVPVSKPMRNDLGDPDNVAKTISLAMSLKQKRKDKSIIIVSKDPAVRILAKSFGILAEDYKFDRVSDISFLSEEIKEIPVEADLINSLYQKKMVKYDLKDARENQSFILQANQTALVRYVDGHFKIIQNDKSQFVDVKPINMDQKFLFSALLDSEISLITVEGLAGSGKTLIAVAYALQQLKDKKFKKIFYTRKTIETGDHSMGFLPGTMEEKMSEYMHGLNDSLDFIGELNTSNENLVKNAKVSKDLKIEAINYIRGRTIPNAIFIVDEAQNITPHDAKTLISRAGKNTKFILLGDNSQIDATNLDKFSNGFTHTIKSFIGKKQHVHIRLKECERSELAKLAAELM